MRACRPKRCSQALFLRAPVAQRIEHLTSNQDGAGSIPAGSTFFNLINMDMEEKLEKIIATLARMAVIGALVILIIIIVAALYQIVLLCQ